MLEEIKRFVAEQYLTSCQTLDLFLCQLDGRPQQRHNLLGSSDLLGVLIRIPALSLFVLDKTIFCIIIELPLIIQFSGGRVLAKGMK